MSLRDMFVEIGMDIDAGPLQDLNNEMDEFKDMIKSGPIGALEKDLKDVSKAADNVTGDFKDIDKEIQNSDGSMGGFKNTILGIGGLLASIGLGTLFVNVGKDAVSAAAEVQAMNAQFDKVFDGVPARAQSIINH